MIAQPSQLSRRVRSIRHHRTVSDEPDEPERRRRGAPCRRFCSAALAAGLALVLLVAVLSGLAAHEPQPRPEAASIETAIAVPDARAPAESSAVSSSPLLHVVLSTDEETPFGLLGAINSTVVHCNTPRALRFHLILPNERRAPLQATLQSLFPSISFRTYSLDTGGVRAKITRHLRPSDRGPIFISPFRLAVAYLPLLLPSLRRVLYLHTDALLFADVAELLIRFRLFGAPAATAPDCATPVSSFISPAAGVRGSDCSFHPSVLLLDLRQWQLLDVASRVEYWIGLNGRGGTALYRPDAAFPPVLLALLPLYARLPPEWGVGHAGRRRLREDEILFWRDHWAGKGVGYSVGAEGPVLILTGGGRAGPRAKALHYNGRFKPWMLGHKPGVESICREIPEGLENRREIPEGGENRGEIPEGGGNRGKIPAGGQGSSSSSGSGGGAWNGGNNGGVASIGSSDSPALLSASGGVSAGLRLSLHAPAEPIVANAPIDVPCRLVWEAYAGGAAAALGWRRRSAAAAATAAEAVAMAEARVESGDMPALLFLEQEGMEGAEGSGRGGGGGGAGGGGRGGGGREGAGGGGVGGVVGGGGGGGKASSAGGKVGATHVAIVCSEATPYGLIAAINSTLMHTAPLTTIGSTLMHAAPPATTPISSTSMHAAPPTSIDATLMHNTFPTTNPFSSPFLRFHILVPHFLQSSLSRKLARIFPPSLRISITSPPADKLTKLGAKLSSVGISSPPFDWPLLWLHLALPPDAKRVVLLPPDALVRTDIRELANAALNGRAAAAFEDCSTTFESLFNFHHPLFKEHHGRASCCVDPDLLVIDLRAWKRDDAPQRLLELVGFQRRNDNLYLQPLAALSPAVPAQLLLDKRAVRLPSRWLARGLARDGWSYSEAAYWHRYWGLQGVSIPLSTKPVRAPNVALYPRREAGDALLLRYSGGAMKPWLKRCGGATASGVALCGRSNFDCVKLWLRQVSEEALKAIEAPAEEGEAALSSSVAAADVVGVRRACVTDLALRKRAVEVEGMVFDADSAFETRGVRSVAVVRAGAEEERGEAQRGGAHRGAAKRGGAQTGEEQRREEQKRGVHSGGAHKGRAQKGGALQKEDARKGSSHDGGSQAHGAGGGGAAGKGKGSRASSSHTSSSHQSSHPSSSHPSASHSPSSNPSASHPSPSHQSSSHQTSSHQTSSHQTSSHHSHISSSSPHHSSPTHQSHSHSSLHHAASTHPASSPHPTHAPSTRGVTAAAATSQHSGPR